MVKPFFLFLRNSWGIIRNPYVTLRELSLTENHRNQIVFIHLLVFIYFFLTSIVKTGFRNPFLLTIKFNSLYLSAYVGFVLMLSLIWLVSRLFKGTGFTRERIILLWSYTLWPTLIWFFLTSLLYILLPPPRTFTYPGKIYSLLYLAASLTLLFWKLILYYLVFRFGLKFDLYKIAISSLVIFPSIALFSWIMYRLSIFKIPFI